MSILMQRPDNARARPSSLLKRDEDYAKIFSSEHPIEIYLIAAKLVKAVQSYLRGRDDLQPKDKNNILFYVTMYAASKLARKAKPNVQELAKIDLAKLDLATIEESVKNCSDGVYRVGRVGRCGQGIRSIGEAYRASTRGRVSV